MTREMLINTVQGQECRIAIVSNGQLEELYIERVSSASHVGNIYKGRITNVEPSIQAAFVDFGLNKNGFLHISDINPSFFPKSRRSNGQETVGRKRAHRDRPPIQECLRRGQEVVVQLTKEGIGTKGPTMTTYLSIPGRLLVMMPGMSRLGVSRKIEDEQARDKARAILAELKPPSDIGFIVRTVAIDRAKRDFQRDLNYLLRLWKNIKQRINSTHAPSMIYQESDLVTRTIRDVYNSEIDRIVCDNVEVASRVKEFLDMALPRSKNAIALYTGREGLFHEYGLEEEIERMYARKMELPSGGSIIFDQAEALVAIDVNSGRFREHSDAETTATRNNIEAAKEIVRQLRLRDLGGVIIIDFIDMREEKNRRAVERVLRDEMRKDRAKTKVARISAFGIVEMTRQRMRPSLKQGIFRTCPHCDGTGHIKSEESQALLVMRSLQRACNNDQVSQVQVSVSPPVAHHLANIGRRQISDLEAGTGKTVIIQADENLTGSEIRINCLNSRGSVVAWEQPLKTAGEARKLTVVPLEEVVHTAPPSETEEIEAGELEAERAEAGTSEFEREDHGTLFDVESRQQEEERELDEARQQEQFEQATPEDMADPSRQPHVMPAAAPVPVAPAAAAPNATAQQPGARPLSQGEPAPGDAPKKKSRRRGRRGGRRHKRRGETQGLEQPTGGQAPKVQPPKAQAPQGQPERKAQQGQPDRKAPPVHHRREPRKQASAAQGATGSTVPVPAEHRKAQPAEPAPAATQGQAQQPAQAPQGEQPAAVPSGSVQQPPAKSGQGRSRGRRPARSHRQDKEYYEERGREAKEASLPLKEVVDEESDDFSTE